MPQEPVTIVMAQAKDLIEKLQNRLEAAEKLYRAQGTELGKINADNVSEAKCFILDAYDSISSIFENDL